MWVADKSADMEVQMVAEMEVDKMATRWLTWPTWWLLLHMVADKVAGMLADMAANNHKKIVLGFSSIVDILNLNSRK